MKNNTVKDVAFAAQNTMQHLHQTSIRKLTSDDFELIFAWENSEELWAVSDESGPFSREQIQAFMNRCLHANPLEVDRWIIEDETQMPIGVVDLFHLDEVIKTASIGIFIAEHAHRKKGHAGRALHLMQEKLRARKWHFIKALIHCDNVASIHLFTSAGFSAGGEQLHKGKQARQYVYCLPIQSS